MLQSSPTQTCASCHEPYDPFPYSLPIDAPQSPCLSSCFGVTSSPTAALPASPRVITQGFHEGTHVDSLSHAVDFRATRRTRVLCARAGVVVEAARHFRRGGMREELRHRANFVCIRHDGGEGAVTPGRCYSRYFHLSAVFVQVGDACGQGAVLGLAGNVGFSQGVHLHFDVVDVLPSQVYELGFEAPGRPRVVVPCVPMSFSARERPDVRLAVCVAAPFDLSSDPELPPPRAPLALVCRRGGAPTFREKAARAELAGAKLLVVVDDDAGMRGALPPLVGDGAARSAPASCWAVLVSARGWASAAHAQTVTLRLASEFDPARLQRLDRPFAPRTLPICVAGLPPIGQQHAA